MFCGSPCASLNLSLSFGRSIFLMPIKVCPLYTSTLFRLIAPPNGRSKIVQECSITKKKSRLTPWFSSPN